VGGLKIQTLAKLAFVPYLRHIGFDDWDTTSGAHQGHKLPKKMRGLAYLSLDNTLYVLTSASSVEGLFAHWVKPIVASTPIISSILNHQHRFPKGLINIHTLVFETNGYTMKRTPYLL